MKTSKERLDLIPELEEEICMSQSGCGVINPIVAAVISMVVFVGT